MRSPLVLSLTFALTAWGCGGRSPLVGEPAADERLDGAVPPDVRGDVTRPDVVRPDVVRFDVPTPPPSSLVCDTTSPSREVGAPSPSCVVLGRVGTWCGKVSVHTRPDGSWAVEDGCYLGCDTEREVCDRHFPGTTRVEEVTVTPVCKPFMTAGCAELYPHRGVREFVCCG